MPLPHLTRRRFLGSSLAAAVGCGLYGWRVEPHWLSIVMRDMPITNLPPAWVGRRIVQISDLHIGPVVDSDYLIAALQTVSDLQPDMTVITGDFMTCRSTEQVDAVPPVLRHLSPGPLGCLAILGNHDYGHRWRQIDAADELVKRLTDLGIKTLQNEMHVVEGLQVVGLDDYWGPRFAPDDVVSQVDWSGPTLTLCHNPDVVDLPRMESLRGWVLAGHTHGGQCKPPFLPPPLLPVRNKRYTAGEFDLGNKRWLYINPGMGYSWRVRINVQPEITVFRLLAA